MIGTAPAVFTCAIVCASTGLNATTSMLSLMAGVASQSATTAEGLPALGLYETLPGAFISGRKKTGIFMGFL